MVEADVEIGGGGWDARDGVECVEERRGGGEMVDPD